MRQEQYDVVIVGSGMGGMCAGALLSRAGLKTLVLERLPIIGGRFSTRDYKGFKISTGGVAVQKPGPVEKLFREVGAELNVRYSNDTAYHIEGKFYDLPAKGRMEKLIGLVARDEEEVRTVMGAIRRGMMWTEPPPSITFVEWLRQFTDNQKIIWIFQEFISGFAMANSDEVPATEFFRISKASPYVEMGIAPQGNISLMESLAKVIRECGGDVWTRSTAKKILIDKWTAKGVIVQKQMEEIEISAKAVINNGSAKTAVKLGGAENFDTAYLRLLQESGPATAQAWIWIASDRPIIENTLAVICDALRVNSITNMTKHCPELAPPGKHLCVVGASAGSSTFPVDFRYETDLCMEDLRNIIPGFDRHVEVILPQYYRLDWPGYRAISGRYLPSKTSVINLYNVGDYVDVPGVKGAIATVAAAESARAVAKDILGRLQ
jgi:phytoene desaturase